MSALAKLLDPSQWTGALLLAAVFIALALILSTILKAILRKVIEHDTKERIDRLTVGFLGNFSAFIIWVVLAIFYAHLIPALDKLGSAMLAGAGIASVVVGLAAQSTLGNLVSGISLVLYKPFRLGDRIQINTLRGWKPAWSRI